MSSFTTISKESEGIYKEKGSKFFALAFPVLSETEIKEILDDLTSKHPKAVHYCYAWRLGTDGNLFRANDDGEPSGTAGRPILGQIDRLGLTNIIVVVVRYYGGKKLGVSGLINAYKSSTEDALNKAIIIEKEISHTYEIVCSYTIINDVLNFLKKDNITIIEKEFDKRCKILIELPESTQNHTIASLNQIEGIELEKVL